MLYFFISNFFSGYCRLSDLQLMPRMKSSKTENKAVFVPLSLNNNTKGRRIVQVRSLRYSINRIPPILRRTLISFNAHILSEISCNAAQALCAHSQTKKYT